MRTSNTLATGPTVTLCSLSPPLFVQTIRLFIVEAPPLKFKRTNGKAISNTIYIVYLGDHV